MKLPKCIIEFCNNVHTFFSDFKMIYVETNISFLFYNIFSLILSYIEQLFYVLNSKINNILCPKF